MWERKKRAKIECKNIRLFSGLKKLELPRVEFKVRTNISLK